MSYLHPDPPVPESPRDPEEIGPDEYRQHRAAFLVAEVLMAELSALTPVAGVDRSETFTSGYRALANTTYDTASPNEHETLSAQVEEDMAALRALGVRITSGHKQTSWRYRLIEHLIDQRAA